MASKTVKWEGVVTKASLPIRKSPDAKAGTHSFSPVKKDTKVQVCDTAKGWYYICVNGKYGYVSSSYIKFIAPAPKKVKPSKAVKWVGKTSQRINLRPVTSAKDKLKAVMPLPKGTYVSVSDTIDGMYYICYKDKYGYVPARYISFVAKATTATAKSVTFLAAVKATQEYARANKYTYGDSQSVIPTADKKISCDRLAAKALWDMGYTDQPKGGIAFRIDIDKWLTSHGFKKSTAMSAIKAGSIVIVMNPTKTSRHLFVVASKKGNSYTRYDCGSQEWIRSKQPISGLHMSTLIAVYNI